MEECGKSEVLYLDTDGMTEAFFEKISNGLSKERKAKAERYRVKRDSVLSLAASYLLDLALKERGLSEKNAVYRYGEHGKPYLKDGGLQFNLSHSGTIAALAVSQREIGVDVQKRVPVSDALVKKVCTESECEYLFALASKEREREFSRLWAVKESVLKFWGTGLTVSPREIEICFSSLTIKRGGKEVKLRVRELPLEGYALAVCTEAEEVSFRKITEDDRGI